MKSTPERVKVVIVGGGFAGIEIARFLAKNNSAAVTLVSKNSCFQYYPSLYRLVVGATVNQVSVPLTKTLPQNVTLVVDAYTGVNAARKIITLQSGKEMNYDYLVLALGSEPNYFGIDGMEAQSKSFLSIDNALALKQHFSDLIKKCKTLPSEEIKMQLHTIIVGAGPSGVEMAGALRPYLVKLAKKAGIKSDFVSVDLLDSSPRVLSTIPEHASALVARQLQKNGVTIYINHGVNSCDENCLKVTNKSNFNNSQPAVAQTATGEEEFHAGTIIWTAGTKINSLYTAIPGVVMTDRKRVTVSSQLTLLNDDTIYVVGDGAGTPFSGLAQTAIDQGKYLGSAIAKRIAGVTVPPYEPKQGAFIIPVGKGWAIFNYKNIVMSGFFVWILRIITDAQYFLSITSISHVLSMLRHPKTTK